MNVFESVYNYLDYIKISMWKSI